MGLTTSETVEIFECRKTTVNIEMELNCTNKWLKKLCLLQKLFIQDIHFVFDLIMQLATCLRKRCLIN